MADGPRVEIREVPKLGSSKEDLRVLSQMVKEDLGFKRKLVEESARVFFTTSVVGAWWMGEAAYLKLECVRQTFQIFM